MSTWLRAHRPSHAVVVAYLALFVALGGSSYAAVTVTGKSVKNSSLTGADVKGNSLTGSDIKGLRSADVTDRSLLARDFKRGQLPVGARGAAGAPGPQGPQGVGGATGATNVVTRVTTAMASASATPTSYNAGATCLPGERATGGGVTPETTALGNDVIAQSYPTKAGGGFPATGDTPTGWAAIFLYNNAPARTLRFYVICVRP